MTPEVRAFVEGLKLDGRTLDIGSYDVNGCVRDLFPDYIGLDMRAGPNVDVICQSWHTPFQDSEFRTVLCLEMLEHDADPMETIREIARLLDTGGSVVITAPGIGFPRHDYPSDFWRFTADGIRMLLTRAGSFIQIKCDEVGTHVFAVAERR